MAIQQASHIETSEDGKYCKGTVRRGSWKSSSSDRERGASTADSYDSLREIMADARVGMEKTSNSGSDLERKPIDAELHQSPLAVIPPPSPPSTVRKRWRPGHFLRKLRDRMSGSPSSPPRTGSVSSNRSVESAPDETRAQGGPFPLSCRKSLLEYSYIGKFLLIHI